MSVDDFLSGGFMEGSDEDEDEDDNEPVRILHPIFADSDLFSSCRTWPVSKALRTTKKTTILQTMLHSPL